MDALFLNIYHGDVILYCFVVTSYIAFPRSLWFDNFVLLLVPRAVTFIIGCITDLLLE